MTMFKRTRQRRDPCGIAEILYEATPPEQLTTLGGIEQAVREQMQKQVMPEVGVFLSPQQRARVKDAHAQLKVFSEN